MPNFSNIINDPAFKKLVEDHFYQYDIGRPRVILAEHGELKYWTHHLDTIKLFAYYLRQNQESMMREPSIKQCVAAAVHNSFSTICSNVGNSPNALDRYAMIDHILDAFEEKHIIVRGRFNGISYLRREDLDAWEAASLLILTP